MTWKGLLSGIAGGFLVVAIALSFTSSVTIGEAADAVGQLVRRHKIWAGGFTVPSGATATVIGTLATTGTVTSSGAVTDTAAYTRSGSGTGTYSSSGDNTYSDGDILMTGAGTDLRVSGGGDVVVSSTGDVQVTGTGDLTVAGQGKFKIQAATVKIPLNLFLEGTLGNITGDSSDGVLIGALGSAAALCRQDDGGSFTSYTSECATGNNDVLFLPATAEVNDAFYIGHATQPFARVNIETTNGVQGVTTMTLVWEYYNGSAWVTLTNLSNTLARQDVVDFDETVGNHFNNFEPPSDWASTSVDSIAGYWIRARVTAFTSSGTDAAGDTITLGITNSGAGFDMPMAGVITTVGFTAATVSGSARDSTFLLMNLTQGTHTLATFTKTTIVDTSDVTDLTIAAGDDLVVMQLREDGTTEHADVGLVLWMEL